MKKLIGAIIIVASIIGTAEPASAQGQVAGRVLKWLASPGAAATPLVKAKPPILAPTPAKAASAAKSDADDLTVTGYVRQEVGKHNAKETGKCILMQKRLPDGTVIKHCPSEQKRSQRR